MKILIINGPNLNMLGVREPEIYGAMTYSGLQEYIRDNVKNKDVQLDFKQSNSEGVLIDYIHSAYGSYDGIIINPAAYTHYSYAIYDAILTVNLPTVEVHITNIHKREEFRHKSVIAAACIGQICGLGKEGYVIAVDYLTGMISEK